MVPATSATGGVEQYILSRDEKFQLYHHMWKECGDIAGVVFIVHGLGEHCHRYDRIIEYLRKQGFRIYSFDHRGHGRTHRLQNQKSNSTQGHQGHIDANKEIIMDDIGQLIDRAKQDGVKESVPKYLMGHSLGGLMVIYYALTRKMSELRGLICLAPAIGICRPPHIILRSLAPYAAKIIPTFTIEGDIRLPDISRIPAVIKEIEDDEMIHRKVSFGTGSVILEMCGELEKRELPSIAVPTLLIHGTADKITNHNDTEKFFNKLDCPMKQLYLHQDGYHKLHDDVGTELVFEEIKRFIEKINK